MTRRPALLAAVACLAWLTLTTGYAAAAAEPPAPIDLEGAPLPGGTGSTNPAEPTTIGPGLWADTLGGSTAQNAHHFTYERRIKDSTVHVGVVAAPTSTESDGLKVDVGVVEGDGTVTSCASKTDSPTYNVPHGLVGVAVEVGATAADATDRPACLRADTLQLVVSRGSYTNASELPVAVKIVEEAPVSGAASLPEPGEELEFDVPDPGQGRELKGADSFEGAPQLDPVAGGTTVSTDLAQGTEQLWRVGVQWGQQLVVRATAPRGDETELERRYSGIPLRVRLVDPRREVFALSSGVEGQSAEGAYDDEEAVELVAGSWPLHYRNRFGDLLPTVPGDYWIAVSAGPVDPEAELEPLDVPVEVTVAVSGKPGGEPSYPKVVVAPDDSAGPGGYSPDQPFLVADGTFSAVASGNPVVSDEDDAWLSGRRWAGLGLGAVSAACLAAGLLRLRARR